VLLENLVYNYQSYFYSPTDAQVNCLKSSFKIYINPYPANVEKMVSS